MLFADLEGGWIAGVSAIILSILSACVAAYASLSKQKAEQKKTETEYLFQEYKDQLKEVKEQFAKDRTIMSDLQKEHTTCREELAASKERLAAQDARIASQDIRIAAQDSRIRHLESLLEGKLDEPPHKPPNS